MTFLLCSLTVFLIFALQILTVLTSIMCIVTLPAGAVAKYCDEHVWVCLSVCKHISRTTHAILINFSVHVAYGRGSVLLR